MNGAPVAGLYALLVGGAVLGAFGDILIFSWAREHASWGLVWGILLWSVSLALMGFLFRHSSLQFSVVVVLQIVIHLLIDILWDVAVMGSRLSHWQWLGVALAGSAIVLLQIGKPH